MMLNKIKTYLLLQAVCIAVLLLCQSVWLFSQPVEAEVVRFYTDRDWKYGAMDFVVVRYTVDHKEYTSRFPGDALDHRIQTLSVRYLTPLPGVVRVDGFVGNWLFSLILYIVWWFVTSLLFLVPNDIVPRGSLFSLNRSFPWLRKL